MFRFFSIFKHLWRPLTHSNLQACYVIHLNHKPLHEQPSWTPAPHPVIIFSLSWLQISFEKWRGAVLSESLSSKRKPIFSDTNKSGKVQENIVLIRNTVTMIYYSPLGKAHLKSNVLQGVFIHSLIWSTNISWTGTVLEPGNTKIGTWSLLPCSWNLWGKTDAKQVNTIKTWGICW